MQITLLRLKKKKHLTITQHKKASESLLKLICRQNGRQEGVKNDQHLSIYYRWVSHGAPGFRVFRGFKNATAKTATEISLFVDAAFILFSFFQYRT